MVWFDSYIFLGCEYDIFYCLDTHRFISKRSKDSTSVSSKWNSNFRLSDIITDQGEDINGYLEYF